MELPLHGMRVIEVGQALAGPLAGVIMADMGADVIKVEKPDGGDDARAWGPPFGPDGETSLYFHSQNRNKRSITLDLKKPEDVEALHKLVETADVLIQNLRPGVVDEIGIGPEAMLKRHPRLVYCSIWAFGYQGPMRLKPGFDPLLQAYGGMMSVTGRPEDPPTFCGASINDKATGMFCVIGALAALRQRDRTGQGCLVDTSLFETSVHWVEGHVNNYLASGDVPKRHGTREQWLTALEAAGVPSGPVNDIAELAATEQLTAVDIVQSLPEGGPRVVGLPISFNRRRPASRRAAPRLGQHNGEILGQP